MMHFSKTLKTTALAGLFGLGVAMAVTSPALAHQSYTRCDRDGDRCWRVVCDDDGDDCRTYSMNTGYYGWQDRDRDNWRRSYWNRDRNRARWVCDRDGDYCRWTYDRW